MTTPNFGSANSPSEQLIVTRHNFAKLTGEATGSRLLIGLLEKDVPGPASRCGELSELFYVANDQTAFEVLCRSIRQDNLTTASMEYGCSPAAMPVD